MGRSRGCARLELPAGLPTRRCAHSCSPAGPQLATAVGKCLLPWALTHLCCCPPLPPPPPIRVARKVVEGGKPALTEFTVLASQPDAPLAAQGSAAPFSDAALAAAVAGGGLSLMACRPLTGRTHQVGGGERHEGWVGEGVGAEEPCGLQTAACTASMPLPLLPCLCMPTHQSTTRS